MTDTKKLIEEARKLAEIQREEAIVEQAIEVSLSPASPSVIPPQEAFNETWDAVKALNDKINLVDLTGKTPAQINDIVKAGGWYSLQEQGIIRILNCTSKDSSQGTTMMAFNAISTDGNYAHYIQYIAPGGNMQPIPPILLNKFKVDTPTENNQATPKKYVDDKFTNNSDKLTSNNVGTSSDQAQIGRAFAGNQFYGYLANNIVVGSGVKGTAQFGCANQAPATVEIATDGSAPITFGTGSTSNITIGSTQTTGTRKLIDKTKEATFEEIIDAAKGIANKADKTVESGNTWIEKDNAAITIGNQFASVNWIKGATPDLNKFDVHATTTSGNLKIHQVAADGTGTLAKNVLWNEIASLPETKQDTLTKVITLTADDGTNIDIKVG